MFLRYMYTLPYHVMWEPEVSKQKYGCFTLLEVPFFDKQILFNGLDFGNIKAYFCRSGTKLLRFEWSDLLSGGTRPLMNFAKVFKLLMKYLVFFWYMMTLCLMDHMCAAAEFHEWDNECSKILFPIHQTCFKDLRTLMNFFAYFL